MSAAEKMPGLAGGIADVAPASRASHKGIITTLESVIASREAVIRLSQQPVGLRTAHRILNLKQKIEELGIAFSQRRDAVAAKKGTPTGNSESEKRWKLEPVRMVEFQAEIGRILKEEVRIPSDVCITLADLDEARISAADLERIAFLVEDLT